MKKLEDAAIKDILLLENYVTAEDVTKAEAMAAETKKPLTEVFLDQGMITHNLLGQAIAESFNVPYADLKSLSPSKEQVLLLSESLARKFNAVVFKTTAKEAVIATPNTDDSALAREAKKSFPKKKVTLAFAFADDVAESFVHYLKPLAERLQKIVKEQGRLAPEILDQIIADAIAYRASDIHLEPREQEVAVRFRVDGVLHEIGKIPKEYYGKVLNRLKVQTHLPIDEHFSAQDGAMRFTSGDALVDLRVSILPTLDGEKVVIRVLGKYVRSFSFTDLGLSDPHRDLLAAAARRPFGMILVVGPTGSGKSTSLYALLKLLNRTEVNITTIEDPVEYKLTGVNQIQVNQQTNLTFAKGLRSIARQDPDVILVGEIRDLETADIAINAALTGHLMLSTFHANDAATAVPRLLEMGIEPFLLSSTLELVIAQRLVRRICGNCRHSVNMSQTKLLKILPRFKEFFTDKTTTLYKGEGCASCGNTGFKGRTAIFEFIPITLEMQELILRSPSSQQVWELAHSHGGTSMFEDGIEKVKNGVTTLEELMRVAEPPKKQKEV